MPTDCRAEHPAIVLRPLPDADALASAARFGGDPALPTDVPWPKDAAGRPMHHVMQIDCARLPAVDPDFPAHGTLFLFITGSQAERGAPI